MIAVEPIVSAGGDALVEEDDGLDDPHRGSEAGSRIYENTLVVTRGKPIVVTAL